MWCKGQFLEDIAKYRNVKNVCLIYADDKTGWRGYYADYWRWKRSDPVFAASVAKYVAKRGNVGRKRLDKGDKSWQVIYCKQLGDSNGNYKKAADVTPYSVREIAEFCDPFATSYDEKFAKMVEEVFLTKAGEVQEKFMGLLDEENYKDFTTSKITHDKAWVFLRALEKLDSNRWGRKSELRVQGRIDHHHSTDRKLPPAEILSRLWEDQARFFDRRKAEILSLPEHGSKEPVIEAEVVGEEDAD